MLKQSIKRILNSLPFVKMYLHGKAIILMLHRVAPIDPNKLPENERLKVDPQGLEEFLQDAIAQGYRFLSLDELYDCIQNNDFKDGKNLIVTLDDGYKDNLTYGLPIFTKYQVPFCTYLCTGFLTKPNMWWFSLEDHLLSRNSFLWNEEHVDISTSKQKSMLFLKIREYVLQNMDTKRSAKTLLANLGIAHDECSYSNLALNQNDVKTLISSPLFTLGCHTESHPVFNNLTFNELEQDIEHSLQAIANLFGIKAQHFCLPFGGNGEINQKYCDFMKKFNFKTIVTTRSGTIYPEHKDYCHVLPRIYIKGFPKIGNLVQFRTKKLRTY